MPQKPQPYMAFGDLLTAGIKQLALQASMKAIQEDLADKLGYSASAIYAWRRGEHLPEPKVIEELARIFVQEWQADQEWIDIFLEKGNYGPPQAATTLKSELFGEMPPVGNDILLGSTTHVSPRANLFINALISWSDDFFHLSKASNHHRSSWAGMVLYVLSVLTAKVTASGTLTVLLALTLWIVTAWFMSPILQWPLAEAENRWMIFLKFGVATIVIPLLVSLVTRPDQSAEFRPPQSWLVWFLKLTGALVGFYTFALTIIGLALAWYYLSGPPFSTELTTLLAAVPLFFSYVVARRLPADRYKMFDDQLRTHEADPFFFGVFLLAGPLTALVINFSYGFWSNRTVTPYVILIALIGIALWEYVRRRKSES